MQPDCLKGRVVCGTVYGDMHLKRSPGINRNSRVSFPSPGFLSSVTWPLLPKKHYNGLIESYKMKQFFKLADLLSYLMCKFCLGLLLLFCRFRNL